MSLGVTSSRAMTITISPSSRVSQSAHHITRVTRVTCVTTWLTITHTCHVGGRGADHAPPVMCAHHTQVGQQGGGNDGIVHRASFIKQVSFFIVIVIPTLTLILI